MTRNVQTEWDPYESVDHFIDDPITLNLLELPSPSNLIRSCFLIRTFYFLNVCTSLQILTFTQKCKRLTLKFVKIWIKIRVSKLKTWEVIFIKIKVFFKLLNEYLNFLFVENKFIVRSKFNHIHSGWRKQNSALLFSIKCYIAKFIICSSGAF